MVKYFLAVCVYGQVWSHFGSGLFEGPWLKMAEMVETCVVHNSWWVLTSNYMYTNSLYYCTACSCHDYCHQLSWAHVLNPPKLGKLEVAHLWNLKNVRSERNLRRISGGNFFVFFYILFGATGLKSLRYTTFLRSRTFMFA